MKIKLVSNAFTSAKELTEFINDEKNEIKRDDILSVTSDVINNTQLVFHIFYYQKIQLTKEEIENQSRILQAVSSRLR
jgi:hypothetical protein